MTFSCLNQMITPESLANDLKNTLKELQLLIDDTTPHVSDEVYRRMCSFSQKAYDTASALGSNVSASDVHAEGSETTFYTILCCQR